MPDRYMYLYNTNQVWVKRRDMYANQEFHAVAFIVAVAGIIHTHIFWILSKYKQKENIKYKHIQLQTLIHAVISF